MKKARHREKSARFVRRSLKRFRDTKSGAQTPLITWP